MNKEPKADVRKVSVEWMREAQAEIGAWPKTEAAFRARQKASMELQASFAAMAGRGEWCPGFSLGEADQARIAAAFDEILRVFAEAPIVFEPKLLQEAAERKLLPILHMDPRVDMVVGSLLESWEERFPELYAQSRRGCPDKPSED